MNQIKKPPTTLEHCKEEHDEVLKLCARIREGLTRKVEACRIREYVEWFKQNYLAPHFEVEEQVVFPILGANVRIKRALANHKRINKLLSCSCEDLRVLNLLEEELSTHVRLRSVYFTRNSKKSPLRKLSEIEKYHQGIQFGDLEWKDKFWLG